MHLFLTCTLIRGLKCTLTNLALHNLERLTDLKRVCVFGLVLLVLLSLHALSHCFQSFLEFNKNILKLPTQVKLIPYQAYFLFCIAMLNYRLIE